ncbi:MAG: hypothetical protein IKV79_04630, partial [Oscillospiraceae bacterium]|nr:hypothetical protein [Oscillospiraceae bacterium]
MKWLSKKIAMFCYQHPRIGIKNLMLYVVAGNVAVWLFSMMDTTGTFINLLTFSAADILRGQVWRLITFVLIPNSSRILILLFFYFYYIIGKSLEQYWGITRFNIFFFSGMLFNIVFGFIVYFITGISYHIDAQFIYFSMFFSLATLFPNTQVLLFFIIPIKIKWLAIVNAAYFLISMLSPPFSPLNLLPLIAFLNYFLLCGGELFSYMRIQNKATRETTTNFKREIHRINYEKRNQS